MSEEVDHVVDRSKWPEGPWDLEKEDKINWIDSETSLDCMLVRNHAGAWCGYVGLPPQHPHHGMNYNVIPWDDYDVHGGLTFTSSCSGHICHVPEDGRPDNVWWLGFDTNHSGDKAPGMPSFGRHEVYRTKEYVVNEVTNLAKQASSFMEA